MLLVNQKDLTKQFKFAPKTLMRWRKDCGMPFLKHPSSNEILFEKEATLKFVSEKKPKYLQAFELAFKRLEKK